MAMQWNIADILAYGDSQLVVKQVNDEYQTKGDKLLPYKRMIDDLKINFLEHYLLSNPQNTK